MNITKNLPVILFALVSASCQKETNDDPVAPSSKVKTYTEDVTAGGQHTVSTFNVAYDANDRIVSLISASSPGDKFLYQYSNGSYTMDIYNSNAISIHEEFYINSNSFVDSTFQYNDTDDSSTEKYIYNSARQLVTIKEYEYTKGHGILLYNTSQYTYDSGGNILKVADNFSTTTYEYYPDLVNPLTFLSPYLPVNKNLIKTEYADYGGSDITISHTYTFDANNRLSTQTITTDSGETAIKTYTYY